MDDNSRFGPSSRFKFGLFFVILICFVESIIFVEAQNLDEHGFKELCNMDLASFLPLPYGSLPNMVCKPVWNSYLLRYSQAKDNVITIVLSTIYTSGWVGMGFSSNGKMINSSCMVGWVNMEGRARIKQYHIKGFKPSEIKPDEGHLPLTSVPPLVVVREATMYMAFQLKFNTTLKTQPILLAFSSKHPHHLRLTVHDDKMSMNFDFSSGNADSNVASSPSIIKNKKTHGVLAILAWGLFLPFGAIFARYLKHKDPLWYYLHVVIQFIGFLFGIAAVVVGFSLNHRLHNYIPAHKGIGIFILTLTILQVTAFFTRPSKDSKYRKYWSWSHNCKWCLCKIICVKLGFTLGVASEENFLVMHLEALD
ncbi:unnamed protein product [Fraxinus pennsylvanica]|uniref:Cytochrome b561 and DOMON domain-containing protein n=1 Tax=Fraxinus pennsylvanica TaxID=56036 RepID=A0AAD1Z795_9LAMI|nr:unnamed protein product [Fraxinus pennsylvanica]